MQQPTLLASIEAIWNKTGTLPPPGFIARDLDISVRLLNSRLKLESFHTYTQLRSLKRLMLSKHYMWNDLKTPISVISYRVGFNHCHQFSAYFKKNFGVRPCDVRKRLIKKKQIRQAKELLANPLLSVDRLIQVIGVGRKYKDEFKKSFSDVTGMSPLEYRNQLLVDCKHRNQLSGAAEAKQGGLL